MLIRRFFPTAGVRASVIASLLLVLPVVSYGQQQISWGSDLLQQNFTSAGPPNTLTADFVFELGSFDEGFDPAENPRGEWAGRWTPLDRTNYIEEDQWFTRVSTVMSNAAPFTMTNQAYIWGYNQSAPVAEWILITDASWTWPNAAGGGGFPINWLVANASTAVVGQINGGVAFHMMTEAVSGLAGPSLSFAVWQMVVFSPVQQADPLVSGPSADPDSDGVSNLFEYGLGSSPLDSADRGDIQVAFVPSATMNNFEVTINRSPQAQVEWSLHAGDDLVNFPNVTGSVMVLEETFTLLRWSYTAPVVDSRHFVRVGIALAE